MEHEAMGQTGLPRTVSWASRNRENTDRVDCRKKNEPRCFPDRLVDGGSEIYWRSRKKPFATFRPRQEQRLDSVFRRSRRAFRKKNQRCLLYTSDAADEEDSVD